MRNVEKAGSSVSWPQRRGLPILVTGGTGFIGRHLVDRLLSEGRRVRLLHRGGAGCSRAPRDGVELFYGDVTDPDCLDKAVRGVGGICHLAGLTHATRAADYRRVNAEGTAHLAHAAARHRVRRFVFVSSLAAAGPAWDGRPRSEEMPLHPISPYGQSKAEGERRLRDELPPKRWTIIRPPIVYGPGDLALLPLFRAASWRVMPLVGFGQRRYSIIYVSDLVRGIIMALSDCAAEGMIFYLTSKESFGQADLLTGIAEAVGTRPLRIRIPIPLIWIAALAGTLRGSIHAKGLTLSRFPDMRPRDWTCTGRLAEHLLGFEPRVPLDEGLRETAQWYIRNGRLCPPVHARRC